jgi:hypothetical protein
MIVMFGSEEKMVYQTHRLLEARMQYRTAGERWLDRLRAIEELLPFLPKRG